MPSLQGGTSGIGAHLVRELATRGAQIILLTQQPPTDPFIDAYVSDLRANTGNDLVYAEQVDLSSLHSIRRFATKWLDNTPARRLDMIVLCAATMTPRLSRPLPTVDGLEPCWGVNYLANFHLLSLLSPSLRVQPPDRDVRIIIATCGSYVVGDLQHMRDSKEPLPKGKEYPTSKLALMSFALAFQKHLDAFARPDKAPNNARVIMVDPGITRTPGMRRWLSLGTIWGLLGYLILWPLYWLVLPSSNGGAQGLLRATMEADLGRGQGGRLFKGVSEAQLARPGIADVEVAEKLWKFSEQQIVALEKAGAVRRSAAATAESENTKSVSKRKP